MTAEVKGWCPGAHRPMASGDGLVVRVRPFRACLTDQQALALCALAEEFGNSMLDLTSRANVQIRGVAADRHQDLLRALWDIDLLDADPQTEGRRNILMPPDWVSGDQTYRLHDALAKAIPDFPDLPEKMGYAVDTGRTACLSDASADLRFERDGDGHLMLRLDGAAKGWRIDERNAMSAVKDALLWFNATGGKSAGRMARHLRHVCLPDKWQSCTPRAVTKPLVPRRDNDATTLGVPFGNIPARDLVQLIQAARLTELRLLPHRLIRVATKVPDIAPFITAPDHPLLRIHACPGAPFCPQATVETRDLAMRLAGSVEGTLHVSGCAKGCARPGKADVTLTGRSGRFDLIRDGSPWDPPAAAGLLPHDLPDLIGTA
ncbi:cobalamin biosynthesis protein CobG [Sagittula sp. NFXS13]|uniref:cobalamin biosynthesis protein CobG n=1 Tax=Sagittula sp. NFXS13 TaxID=2819095 RepID=UPI0032DEC904